VQKAMVEVLNAIYEQDFLDCSSGFRPGRGQARQVCRPLTLHVFARLNLCTHIYE